MKTMKINPISAVIHVHYTLELLKLFCNDYSGEGIPIEISVLPDFLIDFQEDILKKKDDTKSYKNSQSAEEKKRYNESKKASVLDIGGRAARIVRDLVALRDQQDGAFKINLFSKTDEIGHALLKKKLQSEIEDRYEPIDLSYIYDCDQARVALRDPTEEPQKLKPSPPYPEYVLSLNDLYGDAVDRIKNSNVIMITSIKTPDFSKIFDEICECKSGEKKSIFIDTTRVTEAANEDEVKKKLNKFFNKIRDNNKKELINTIFLQSTVLPTKKDRGKVNEIEEIYKHLHALKLLKKHGEPRETYDIPEILYDSFNIPIIAIHQDCVQLVKNNKSVFMPFFKEKEKDKILDKEFNMERWIDSHETFKAGFLLASAAQKALKSLEEYIKKDEQHLNSLYLNSLLDNWSISTEEALLYGTLLCSAWINICCAWIDDRRDERDHPNKAELLEFASKIKSSKKNLIISNSWSEIVKKEVEGIIFDDNFNPNIANIDYIRKKLSIVKGDNYNGKIDNSREIVEKLYLCELLKDHEKLEENIKNKKYSMEEIRDILYKKASDFKVINYLVEEKRPLDNKVLDKSDIEILVSLAAVKTVIHLKKFRHLNNLCTFLDSNDSSKYEERRVVLLDLDSTLLDSAKNRALGLSAAFEKLYTILINQEPSQDKQKKEGLDTPTDSEESKDNTQTTKQETSQEIHKKSEEESPKSKKVELIKICVYFYEKLVYNCWPFYFYIIDILKETLKSKNSEKYSNLIQEQGFGDFRKQWNLESSYAAILVILHYLKSLIKSPEEIKEKIYIRFLETLKDEEKERLKKKYNKKYFEDNIGDIKDLKDIKDIKGAQDYEFWEFFLNIDSNTKKENIEKKIKKISPKVEEQLITFIENIKKTERTYFLQIAEAKQKFGKTKFVPYKEAWDFIKTLKSLAGVSVYIATEGDQATQLTKLRQSGLTKLIDEQNVLSTGLVSTPEKDLVDIENLKEINKKEIEKKNDELRKIKGRLNDIDKIISVRDLYKLDKVFNNQKTNREYYEELKNNIFTYIEELENEKDHAKKRIKEAEKNIKMLNRFEGLFSKFERKDMKAFYALIAYAIENQIENPDKSQPPQESLKTFNNVQMYKTKNIGNSSKMKIVMLGDRLQNDIKPLRELFGNDSVITIKIKTKKYKDEKYKDEKIPTIYEVKTLEEAMCILLSPKTWEIVNYMPYPVILDYEKTDEDLLDMLQWAFKYKERDIDIHFHLASQIIEEKCAKTSDVNEFFYTIKPKINNSAERLIKIREAKIMNKDQDYETFFTDYNALLRIAVDMSGHINEHLEMNKSDRSNKDSYRKIHDGLKQLLKVLFEQHAEFYKNIPSQRDTNDFKKSLDLLILSTIVKGLEKLKAKPEIDEFLKKINEGDMQVGHQTKENLREAHKNLTR